MRRFSPFIAAATLATTTIGYSGSVEKPAVDHSPEAQIAAFEIADGYELSLFACEEDQIANPIAMHFDGENRLWVLCSLVYPQLVPTEKADDKIYILEDTDHDGHVDKTTVFVEGLNMPTGFALGDGGVYVGEGADLVFLRDDDGDDKADTKRTLFTGFGTGDTHQNINSFTWSPDGELLFCQGLHAFSRIQTPWGIERLDEHGVWRMRPRRLQLTPFRGVAGQNPWGIGFGHWGEGFVKGNGTSLSELTPVSIPTQIRAKEMVIGKTQIKAMGALVVDSPALPDDLQGNVLIAGYYAHIIDRMKLERDGAGHKTENLPPLLKTEHSGFRPVDLKIGPDGAIYIADWYNPIIGHYQASLRHPDRDKRHGRIWRITAKNQSLTKRPHLSELATNELVEKLGSEFRYERERARELLSSRPTSEVVSAVKDWATAASDEHHLYQALCVLAWHEHPDKKLLQRLRQASEPHARAFAARLESRWQDRIPGSIERLKKSVLDKNARVRLESIVALSSLKEPDAFATATLALEEPTDRFLTTALTQAAHYQKPIWFPAMKSGEIEFPKPNHLAFALKATGGKEALATVRSLFNQEQNDSKIKGTLLTLLAESRNPNDQITVLEYASKFPSAISALVNNVALSGSPSPPIPGNFGDLLLSKDNSILLPAIRLTGLWKLAQYDQMISTSLLSKDDDVRAAAILSHSQIRGKQALAALNKLAQSEAAPVAVGATIQAALTLDAESAAIMAAGILQREEIDSQTVSKTLTPFIKRTNGLDLLATKLPPSNTISPKTIEMIRAAIGKAGAYSAPLEAAIGMDSTKGTLGIPDFSDKLVSELTQEALSGDPEAGKKVFSRAALSCVACHKIGGEGPALGPDLSAVGAGLPVELIIESIIWPGRQVKEGYLSSLIASKSGEVINGYIQNETDAKLTLRDAATGKTTEIATNRIQSRVDAGTLMPPGLTASLTRKEFADLISYLAALKG